MSAPIFLRLMMHFLSHVNLIEAGLILHTVVFVCGVSLIKCIRMQALIFKYLYKDMVIKQKHFKSNVAPTTVARILWNSLSLSYPLTLSILMQLSQVEKQFLSKSWKVILRWRKDALKDITSLSHLKVTFKLNL